jgi:hypothetical protein
MVPTWVLMHPRLPKKFIFIKSQVVDCGVGSHNATKQLFFYQISMCRLSKLFPPNSMWPKVLT